MAFDFDGVKETIRALYGCRWKKKEEATEAIQTVIAQYGYTPEFSDFRKQVGAVVSSLNKVSPKTDEKSKQLFDKKTPGQAALLDRPNALSLPPNQGPRRWYINGNQLELIKYPQPSLKTSLCEVQVSWPRVLPCSQTLIPRRYGTRSEVLR